MAYTCFWRSNKNNEPQPAHLTYKTRRIPEIEIKTGGERPPFTSIRFISSNVCTRTFPLTPLSVQKETNPTHKLCKRCVQHELYYQCTGSIENILWILSICNPFEPLAFEARKLDRTNLLPKWFSYLKLRTWWPHTRRKIASYRWLNVSMSTTGTHDWIWSENIFCWSEKPEISKFNLSNTSSLGPF